MRSFFAAIGAAFRAGVSAIRSFLSFPGRIIGSMLGAGGGGFGVPPAPEVAQLDVRDAAAEKARFEALSLEIANLVMGWCANSMVAGQPCDLPPRLPRAVREWLPGISRDEAEAVICADEKAVSAHLRSLELIEGVRSVRALEAARWSEEPDLPFDRGSPSFVSYAHAPERA